MQKYICNFSVFRGYQKYGENEKKSQTSFPKFLSKQFLE